jgi:putative ABC transport system substrate-binding protein
MKRREFIGYTAGLAAVWSVAARAQGAPTIGYCSGRSPETEQEMKTPILRALQEAGFVDGRNVKIEYRFSNGEDARLPALANELVRSQVALLIATDTPSALVAKSATASIPIVFSSGSDPVNLGLVDSLNRPGGNLTGVAVFVNELTPKRLQLIREIVPRPNLIGFMVNLNTKSGPPQLQAIKAAAEALRQEILVLSASSENEIDTAFATLVEHKASAIVYSSSVFFQVTRTKLVALAAQHGIPAIYEWPEFVRAGGLISYSSSRAEAGRQIGAYAAQILKGAKPGDLPVIQSTKFDLAVNLKTAKALGLNLPASLLATADEIVD